MRLASIVFLGMAAGAVAAAPSRADPAAGQAAFDGNGCAECHYT